MPPQLKRKQLPEQEDSDDENEQFDKLSSSDDEQPMPKHPKLSSPSSSSTPLITSTSTNTTNETMNSSNDDNEDGNAILFQEMNHINSKLISLDHHFSIRADYKYFIDHQEMLDEFNENVQHFLWKVNHQRKRVAIERLSEDALFHILQYVSKSDLFRNCRKVSSLWRQQVLKKELKVELGYRVSDPYVTTESLLKSEFIGRVVWLRLIDASANMLELLARYSNSLSNLKHLDLAGNTLGVEETKYFKQVLSSCKNLTSLNLSRVEESSDEEQQYNMFSVYFNNQMLKDLAGISQLSKLTHLELNHEEYDEYDGLEEFLQSKVNLQYLSLQHHNLKVVPNLFTINSTSNMNSNTAIFNDLTKLNISECIVTNQMILDIILSPKLPNLTTLIATDIRQSDQINTSISTTTTNNSTFSSIGGGVGVGYRNSSNLTELNMNNSCVNPVAEMIKFTPKLKKLLILYLRNESTKDRYAYDSKMLKDYSFLVHTDSKLSQLEYLEITRSTALIELVLTNLIFSNLKYLNCTPQWNDIGEDDLDREIKIIEECVNLTKLERVSKTIQGGYIPHEQEVKVVQAFRNNPMFNSNQLKIEDFRYESVYPNDKKTMTRYISY